MLTREQWWSATTQITYSVSGTEINKDDKWWSVTRGRQKWLTRLSSYRNIHGRSYTSSTAPQHKYLISQSHDRSSVHLDTWIRVFQKLLMCWEFPHTAISEFTENVRKGPVRVSLGDNRQSASSWERGNRNSNDQPQYADPQVPHLPAVNNKLKPLNDNRRWKNAAWSEAQFLLPQSNSMKAWILPISGWWRRDGERELWMPQPTWACYTEPHRLQSSLCSASVTMVIQ